MWIALFSTEPILSSLGKRAVLVFSGQYRGIWNQIRVCIPSLGKLVKLSGFNFLICYSKDDKTHAKRWSFRVNESMLLNFISTPASSQGGPPGAAFFQSRRVRSKGGR